MTDGHQTAGKQRPCEGRWGAFFRFLFGRVARFSREWFFKRRFVFVVERETYVPLDIQSPPCTLVLLNHRTIGKPGREEKERYLEWLSEGIGREKVTSRIRNPAFTVLLALDSEGGGPIGYVWSLEAGQDLIWHDKFCVSPGEVLSMNSYVAPEHRRKGVYQFMMDALIKHHLQTRGCGRLFEIFEDDNVAVGLAKKQGHPILYTNFLIKFFGSNIFSVYRGKGETKVFYVFRNEKGKML